MFIYPIYNNNGRNVSTIYIYIKRLASKEMYWEVDRTKELRLSAPKYFSITISTPPKSSIPVTCFPPAVRPVHAVCQTACWNSLQQNGTCKLSKTTSLTYLRTAGRRRRWWRRLLAVKTGSADRALNRAVGLETAINTNQGHRLHFA